MKALISLIAVCLVFQSLQTLAQEGCKKTTNFFESTGGRSSDQDVKSSDGCKTLILDDGFEKVTLVLGSLPEGTADFTIVDHDATPGEGEIAVTYFYYSGNAEETLELGSGNKTAQVCAVDGKVVVRWSNVTFKGTANGKLNYKTSCEMSCGG